MGRQAYITRLALGRSPYEAPLLSESGDFILGQYAHQFDNTDGYTQQFNERGHPEFRASRAAARELRRAKNDVLSTVGVVYRKAAPTQSKEDDAELVRLTRSENEVGYVLSSIDGLMMVCSLWWLFALRMRLQVFESYSLSVTQIAKSELRVFGICTFLFAGLPACLASAMLSTWRKYWMGGYVGKLLAHFGFRQIFEFVFLLLSSSIELFVRLQCLHLIPADQSMSMTSLIPFSHHSPIQMPSSFFGAVRSPVVLLWTYTWLYGQLQPKIRCFIQNLHTKPGESDWISVSASEGSQGVEPDAHGLRERDWMLFDGARFQASKLEKWLRGLVRQIFVRRPGAENGSPSLPDGSLASAVAPNVEADDDRTSTATPDPADLFDIIEFEDEPDGESGAAECEHHPLSRANTLFTPLNQSPATTPPASPRLRASLVHRDSETVTMQLELLVSQRISEAESRGQGFEVVEGAASASQQAAVMPTTAIGVTPADGQTMVSELGRAIQETSEDEYASDQEREEEDQAQRPRLQPRPQHRVTRLSRFASEAFASHAACLVTTAALIPLETLFLRSLASAFLGSSPVARDVRPLFPGWWRHGLKFDAALVTVLGLQALVSSAVWGIGTAAAIGLGRMKFRWGKL